MTTIGLWGCYGLGSVTDDIIEQTIKQEISQYIDADFVRLFNMSTDWDGLKLDLVVVGGGTLLGICDRRLERVKAPLVILGTGFREICEGGDATLSSIWANAKLIGLRGEVSKFKMQKLGFDVSKVKCLGDPIFLRENAHKEKGGYIGGVVRHYGTIGMRETFEYIGKDMNLPIKIFNFNTSQGDWLFKDFGIPVNDDVYDGLCKANFWYGNRLHTFCLSLINEIPTIGVELEYSKMTDICSMVPYPFRYGTCNGNIGGKTSIKIYKSLKEKWGEVNKETQIRISEVRSNLKELVKETVELCQ